MSMATSHFLSLRHGSGKSDNRMQSSLASSGSTAEPSYGHQPIVLLQRRSNKLDVPKFELNFQFIDGLGGKTERKKSRSHITAQHYRRKRYEEKQEREARLYSLVSTGQPSAASRDPIPTALHESWLEFEKQYRYEKSLQVTKDVSPRAFGGGRVDPFASYPIVASSDVHQLVDHYCYVIPSLVHRYWSRAIRRPRSCWDLFNLYRKDSLSFLGMLHHTAHHLASMRGYQQTMQTAKFKQEILKGLNQKLAVSGGPHEDGTVIAVGLLANGERLWGNREVARMHWSALKCMLLERGGFPSLKHDIILHSKLLWSFIALSWPASEGNPAYIDNFSEASAAVQEMAGSSPGSAFRMSCDELSQFISHRREQVLQQASHRQREDNVAEASEVRCFVLVTEIGISLHPIEVSDTHPDKRRALENCRMSCLIFLNLVLVDHGEDSATSREYFSQLSRIINEQDDDSILTSEHLLWTLLSSPITVDHFDRCWKLSRLIGVVKKVGTRSWRVFADLLWVLLAKPCNGAELTATLRSWDASSFIEEATRVLDDASGDTVRQS